MDLTLLILFGVIAVVLLGALVLSVSLGKNQKKIPEASSARVKHPVVLNPIFWSYIVFAAVLIALAYYLSLYYGEY